MTFVCTRYPCGLTSGGCSHFDCPQHRGVAPAHHWVVAQPPQGCICPPTSEQTCKSPTCPRQNHLPTAGAR